ncbi:unnamed protein product, partial [Strongylus vulgaris]
MKMLNYMGITRFVLIANINSTISSLSTGISTYPKNVVFQMNDTVHIWNDVWECVEKKDRKRDTAAVLVTMAALFTITGGGDARILVRCECHFKQPSCFYPKNVTSTLSSSMINGNRMNTLSAKTPANIVKNFGRPCTCMDLKCVPIED